MRPTRSPVPAKPTVNDETRLRLLEAAGIVFAETGYQTATIREICARAGANVAAVNYYFGDKLKLYKEVLRHAICADATPEIAEIFGSAMPAEKKLRRLIEFMVHAMNDESRPYWATRMLLHEMAQPTPALGEIVDQVLRPRYDMLRNVIAEVIGRSSSDHATHLCAHSIIGQIRHYAIGRGVVTRLWPRLKFTPPFIGEIAGHIAAFSLAGLASEKKRSGAGKDAGRARLQVP